MASVDAVLVSPACCPIPSPDPRLLGGVPMIGQPSCACQSVIDDALRDHGVEPDYAPCHPQPWAGVTGRAQDQNPLDERSVDATARGCRW